MQMVCAGKKFTLGFVKVAAVRVYWEIINLTVIIASNSHFLKVIIPMSYLPPLVYVCNTTLPCGRLRVSNLGWSRSGLVIQDYWNHDTSNELMYPFLGWIHTGHAIVGSFDLLWSEWSLITDSDVDHPNGTHPTHNWSLPLQVYEIII